MSLPKELTEEENSIYQEIELDLANEGLTVGEIFSLINHWKNKYNIKRKESE